MRAIAASALLAGCFGTGPEPTTASEAQILLALDIGPLTASGQCNPVPFIGNVAVIGDQGYVATHAYLPACQDGMGNSQATIPSDVLQFSIAGGPVQRVASAGSVMIGGGPKPRVGGSPLLSPVWTEQNPNGGGIAVQARDAGDLAVTFGTTNAAVGIVGDDSALYIGAWNVPGGPYNMNDPRYPCCGGGNQVPGNADLVKVSPPSAVTPLPAPGLSCKQVKDCLVASSDTLFYVKDDAGAAVSALPKAGGSDEVVARLDLVPTGLAADAAHVAWSASLDFTAFFGSDALGAPCTIQATATTRPYAPRTLLHSEEFACLDVALAGDFVYFTIGKLVRRDQNSDPVVVNLGIGRVDITTLAVETLALGIDGPEVGPRWLFVVGDQVVLVSPFVVAKLPTSVLDGAHDL
jgi:hypothetical protein